VPYIFISAATTKNIDRLKDMLYKTVTDTQDLSKKPTPFED